MLKQVQHDDAIVLFSKDHFFSARFFAINQKGVKVYLGF
jgi:hypothetical protein